MTTLFTVHQHRVCIQLQGTSKTDSKLYYIAQNRSNRKWWESNCLGSAHIDFGGDCCSSHLSLTQSVSLDRKLGRTNRLTLLCTCDYVVGKVIKSYLHFFFAAFNSQTMQIL